MKSLEQECLDILALLRHEAKILQDEIAQKEAWLAELRRTRSDVVVVVDSNWQESRNRGRNAD